MAIMIKTLGEIQAMREGGKILAEVMEKVISEVAVGKTTKELDKLAEKLILEAGGEISFRTVRNYQYATCMCVNDEVVHAIPTDYKLKEEDLLGIDCGVLYQGLHVDMSETVVVGSNETNLSNLTNFLAIGKNTLEKAIAQAKIGNRIGHISKAIQDGIENAGYRVVRNLTGHGVGRTLHEEPMIPGILRGKIEETPEILEGMTLAIEVIYNQGKPDVVYKDNNGWTIVSKDGSLSATFEKTVAIFKNGPEILTAA